MKEIRHKQEEKFCVKFLGTEFKTTQFGKLAHRQKISLRNMMFDPIYNATPTQFNIFNDFWIRFGIRIESF